MVSELSTSGWFRPKYSGPAMAVLGGGGRSSPAALLASISPLMRFSTCIGDMYVVQG